MTKEITYTVKVNKAGTYWYLGGKLHREDGPAIDWANGDKSWWLNGKLHREDGPAIEYKSWYLNGKYLYEQEFLERTQKVQELTVAEIEKLLGYTVKIVK